MKHNRHGIRDRDGSVGGNAGPEPEARSIWNGSRGPNHRGWTGRRCQSPEPQEQPELNWQVKGGLAKLVGKAGRRGKDRNEAGVENGAASVGSRRESPQTIKYGTATGPSHPTYPKELKMGP